MEILKCRADRKVPREDDSKVLFACHPDDFNDTFDKIYDYLHRAIIGFKMYYYYTEDGYTADFMENLESVLADINMVVIPVTSLLLKSENCAVYTIISCAREQQIPVFPVVIGEGFYDLYHSNETFRELNYHYDTDYQYPGYRYRDHLDSYLDIVLRILVRVDRIYGKEGRGNPAERIIKAAEGDEEIEPNQALFEPVARMYYYGLGVPRDFNKAISWAERSFEFMKQFRREDHPETIWIMSFLIDLLEESGSYEKAARLEREMDDIIDKFFESVHHRTWLSRGYNMKYLIRAGKKHLDSRIFTRGQDAPATIRAIKLMIHYYHLSTDPHHLEKAIDLVEKLYQILSRKRGEIFPETIMVKGWQICLYAESGDYDKVTECGEELYRMQKSDIYLIPPSFLLTMYRLIRIYHDFGYCEKVKELEELLYSTVEKLPAAEYPKKWEEIFGMIYIYADLGEKEKAFTFADKLYEILYQVSKEESPRGYNELHALIRHSFNVRALKEEKVIHTD